MEPEVSLPQSKVPASSPIPERYKIIQKDIAGLLTTTMSLLLTAWVPISGHCALLRKSKRKLNPHSCLPRRRTDPRLPEYETGVLPIKVIQMEPARGDAAVAAAVNP